MKFKLIISYLSLILLLFSCNNDRGQITHYIHIQNNTGYNVTMNIVDNEDTSLILKEYSIPAHQKIFADTTIYETTEREKLQLIQGEGNQFSPYWNINTSSNRYNFENIKLTRLLSNPGNDICDTSSTIYYYNCNYREEEKIGPIETERNFFETTETVTYYITQQQYNNADSI